MSHLLRVLGELIERLSHASHISRCRVVTVVFSLDQGLGNLRSLNLRDNELTKIPSLITLRNLEFADFSFNDLRVIEHGVLPSVRQLNLEG